MNPTAGDYPECQKNAAVFELAEAAVRRALDKRWPSDIAAVDAVSAQLAWCRECFMAPDCRADMIAARYSGIAGGEFLEQGRIIAADRRALILDDITRRARKL